ncbi:MAG: hypothetical protein PSV23_11040 [Brevundimonas sp.]|uniref:hypothetical protein n=1 Tax=Brevundimonas sp. TaxID=1871086 RepID=UPI0024874B76|nr:hypothetical protein [Brevundimonas sp.]MDI1327321.1 hypothetical protein [Brevundimonas sp.]
MSLAVVRSSLTTSLARYGRSMGLWILLLVAPVGARFMIAARGADATLIAVDNRVPWLTSPVLGVTLGVVIATLLLPVAFIYLRSNATRRQPWQVEEVSPAGRVSIAYGRWLADIAVLAAVLAATTAAGCLLAVLLLPLNEVDPASIILTLWVIAAPPVAMVASLRLLLDARRWTRGPLGEVLFFVFWMGSLVLVMVGGQAGGYAANMTDLPGFMSPISYGQGGTDNFIIGGAEIPPGSAPIHLDVMSGVMADGYLAARLSWLGMAALIPLLAGLIYAPHAAGKTRKTAAWLKFLEPGRARPADPGARPARAGMLPGVALIVAEARLMAGNRKGLLAMAVVAAAGLFAPWSTLAGPAAMLLLVFATTAHAGRSEQKGLLALTTTAALSPAARRIAFVLAGTALALAMAAPAAASGLMAGDTRVLLEAAAVGAATSATAIILGALTRSATAPRLVLLIAWYFYLNAGGAAAG